MISYISFNADWIDRKRGGFCARKMTIRTILAILWTGFLASSNVQAESKVLLSTNALGYTKDDRTVAYSDNYVVDSGRAGQCVNGPPPDTWKAPDAQTTSTDATCQTLVRLRFTFAPAVCHSCEWDDIFSQRFHTL